MVQEGIFSARVSRPLLIRRFVASERLLAWVLTARGTGARKPLPARRRRWPLASTSDCEAEDAVVCSQPGRLKWHQRDAVLLRSIPPALQAARCRSHHMRGRCAGIRPRSDILFAARSTGHSPQASRRLLCPPNSQARLGSFGDTSPYSPIC